MSKTWCTSQLITYSFTKSDLSALPIWISSSENVLTWTAEDSIEIEILVTVTTAKDTDTSQTFTINFG